MIYQQRYSSFCGGKQLKFFDEQNAWTPSPSYKNPIIEIHTDGGHYITFKYKNGSMANLNLKLEAGESPKVFFVPEGQVAQVILYYYSRTNVLDGISMVDRKGNTLFKTIDSRWADASHAISLQEGESIVGFRSRAGKDGKTASHCDFQFIIAKEVEEELDEDEDVDEECWCVEQDDGTVKYVNEDDDKFLHKKCTIF